MSEITIFHNPRCSKSRQTLQLLQDRGIEPVVNEYLKQGLTQLVIQELKQALAVQSVREFMRTKEVEYKDADLKNANEQQLIEALIETPKLLERPIVIKDKQARIGRPPENVIDLL